MQTGGEEGIMWAMLVQWEESNIIINVSRKVQSAKNMYSISSAQEKQLPAHTCSFHIKKGAQGAG